MSIDAGKSNYLENLTPAINFLRKLDENPEVKKLSIIEETSERRKELLEEELKKGKQINSENEFTSFIKLLRLNNITDIKTSFQNINNGNPIVIQNNSPKDPFFDHPIKIFYIHPNNEKGINGRLGYIDKNGNFIQSMDRDNNITYIPITLSNEIETQVKEPEVLPPTPDKNYKIQKGDSLWKIIEEHYDLSGSDDKNRDIANIILRLGKLKENKGVIDKKDGTIYTGKILHLPGTIGTIRLPKHDKKTFTLKK